jgi:hypothetical protein
MDGIDLCILRGPIVGSRALLKRSHDEIAIA